MKKKMTKKASAKKNIKREIRRHANKKQAKTLSWFFKTGKGQYGEGDKFLGIKVPPLRALAKAFSEASFKEIEELLKSPYHEERLTALLILVKKYTLEKSEEAQEKIYKFYIKNMKHINNWDLVDLSAQYIIGHFLEDKNKSILFKWAKSKDLWTRRIAIISTLHLIRQGHFATTLKIAKMLLKDEQDLIHKATGWLLREIGKRDLKTLEGFLKEHYQTMPRTMLRYAIEKFPEQIRQAYLKGMI